MNSKKLIFVLGLLLIIPIVSNTAFSYITSNYVIIRPDNPVSSDDLICRSADNDYYYFVWEINGIKAFAEPDIKQESRLSHTLTQKGDTVKCISYYDSKHRYEVSSDVVQILNSPPVAVIQTSTDEARVGEVITFDASQSYDPDNDELTYLWDFGDGTTSELKIVNHSYSAPGKYLVMLVVSDGNRVAHVSKQITIKESINHKPVIAVEGELRKEVIEGETLTFHIEATDIDNDELTVSINGKPSNADFILVEQIPGYVRYIFNWTPNYEQAGVYVITISTSDGKETAHEVIAVEVLNKNRMPVAIMQTSTDEAIVGEAITFDASQSYDPDNDEVTYLWNFGDGTTSDQKIITHNYYNPGDYTATLTISDGELTDSVSKTITIYSLPNHKPLIGVEFGNSKTVNENEKLEFNVSVLEPDKDPLNVNIIGKPENAEFNLIEQTQGYQKYLFTWTPNYEQAGEYEVIIEASDGKETSQETIYIEVLNKNRPPVAVLTVSATQARVGEAITFDASESYDLDNDELVYLWDFGDGTTSDSEVAEHYYSTPGKYNVTLTVSDGIESNSQIIMITINEVVLENHPPVAVLTASATQARVGEAITFDASQSYDPDNDELTYLWDFGDGTTSDSEVVEHYYSTPGEYLITLTVSDGEYNDSDSVTVTITGQLNISEIQCFDKIVAGKKQVCSVKIVDDIHQPMPNALVKILNSSNNVELASCTTDSISGGCSAEFIANTLDSTQEIIITAQKNGYFDAIPKVVSFEVLTQRYQIQDFEIFSDPNYSITSESFYRGDSLYVRFKVYDLEQGKFTEEDVVKQAILISYEAGGYIVLENDSNADALQPEFKHFKVTIPLSHFFIGESAVFGFAINLIDNSMGEVDKKIVILNNPPEIIGNIPNIVITQPNQAVMFDLSGYAFDKEDGYALSWQPYSYYSTLLSVQVINGTLLKVTPKAPVKTTTTLTLIVYDLDNDYASTVVNVVLNIEPELPECFVGETRKCGPETNKGICEFGIQTCIDGHWSECVGAVYPQPEIKNGLDDNCNGFVDEGFSKTSREEIEVGRITYQTEAYRGKNLDVSINIENKKAEKVQFSVWLMLPDLGIGKKLLINADAGESVHRLVQLEIPDNIKPGEYLLRLSINNGEFNRIKHRIITIK